MGARIARRKTARRSAPMLSIIQGRETENSRRVIDALSKIAFRAIDAGLEQATIAACEGIARNATGATNISNCTFAAGNGAG